MARAGMGIAQAVVVVLLGASSAAAHYNMLLPERASVRRGETVTLTYQWGHPFEHELSDAPRPASLRVFTPDGKEADLTSQLEKKTVPSGSKEAVVYRLSYRPEVRGDHVFVLRTPAIWMEEEGELVEDVVKLIVHVQAQKGWERSGGSEMEMEPLTRPYGLQPGMVFQARLSAVQGSGPGGSAPLAGLLVEIERYNERRPARLPPDEHITRTARTDAQGVVTTTLTEPGWWCLTGAMSAGKRTKGDQQVPVRKRSTLWVFVDEPISSR